MVMEDAVESPTVFVNTVDAYNEWAAIYDTDGNMLVAMDDLILDKWLDGFLSEVLTCKLSSIDASSSPLRLVDLGCGTGRNTVRLLEWCNRNGVCAEIVGIDASEGMLEVAARKMLALETSQRKALQVNHLPAEYRLLTHNFLDPSNHNVIVPCSSLGMPSGEAPFDAAISTLVLEHFPLEPFFSILTSLVRQGGSALITNMHAEMGQVSQAGFRRTDERGKVTVVRDHSYIHTVEETTQEAFASGWRSRRRVNHGENENGEAVESEVGNQIGAILEMKVTHDILGQIGERGRKWVGFNVWYGMIVDRGI